MVGAMIGRNSVALKIVASLLIEAYFSLVITEIPAVNPAPGVIGEKLHAWKWVK